MASAVIHMAVAHELNKNLKRNNDKLLIGAIAPDIAKCVGETKIRSHFLDDLSAEIPNLDRFLSKYQKHLSDDFVMGYFIHLYTDFLWEKYFLTEFLDKDMITKLDGTVVKCNGNMLSQYLYNDYTNVNVRLLDEYNMNLSAFYNELPELDNIIEEIPMDKLNILMDKISLIIQNTKEHKDFVFDISNIKTFVDTSVDLILSEINEIC